MTQDPRRRLTLLALGATALFLAGCTSKPLRPANADGTYCYRIGKSNRRRLTCTPGPIPLASVEADAKRFAPTSDRVTVFIVRQRWADTRGVVTVSTSNGTAIDTVPESFARWRLPPGRHRLTATWPEGSTSLEVAGSAGEVIYVELVGSAWAGDTRFRLELGEPVESRERATGLRLVADIG